MQHPETLLPGEGKEKLVSERLIVVKIGGAKGIDLEAICVDIAELHRLGESFVLVHGGSEKTSQLSKRLGYPPIFSELSSGAKTRYTPPEILKIFTMAVCGMNKDIVTRLQGLGVNAIGLSGVDGRLLEGKCTSTLMVAEGGKKVLKRDNRAGKLEKVNLPLLKLLLGSGYLQVICPPILSQEGAINVDADSIAALVAGCLEAGRLFLLTNVPGILRDTGDESSLMPTIDLATPKDMEVGGRMTYKLKGARLALESGVNQVTIADGRVAKPVTNALMGRGTVVTLGTKSS